VAFPKAPQPSSVGLSPNRHQVCISPSVIINWGSPLFVAMLLTSLQREVTRNLEPRGTGCANVAEIFQQNPGISSIPLREPPAGCRAA
jgi:hypothetical protein